MNGLDHDQRGLLVEACAEALAHAECSTAFTTTLDTPEAMAARNEYRARVRVVLDVAGRYLHDDVDRAATDTTQED
jgi:hypothetical protein